ncbi:MAG: YlzJ-like family protein [Bacillota bacterium]|nr:YlzJ-like family protein [Bacillota bacterium]
MTLYTPLSPEMIYQEVEWLKAKPKKLIELNGVAVEVELLENGELKIERIHSTNPQDYLNAALQPGTKIDTRW